MDIKNWLRKVTDRISGNKTEQDEVSQLTNVEASAMKPKLTAEDVIEKFDDGFVRLITRLDGINENISTQLNQNEQLAKSLGELPRSLECFPELAKNQKDTVEAAVDQMRYSNDLNHNIVKALESIPQESLRQTEAVYDVRDTISESLEVNRNMKKELSRFNDTISRLESTASSQTESIMQMSRTFASSERYFKYMMDKQSKKFLWIFVSALSVSLISILALAGIVVYLILK